MTMTEQDEGVDETTEEEVLVAAAITSHSTDTSDAAWDGPAQEAKLSNDAGASVFRKAYAWVDPDKDADTKAAYKFIHHFVTGGESVGAASTKACSTGIGVLNGGRGGTKIPDADRKGVFNHLVRHLKDSGVADDDLPKLMARELVAHMAAQHGPTSGTHTHAHATYGDQGEDAMHEHMHSHRDDANHGHDHSKGVPSRAETASMSAGMASFVASAHESDSESNAEERFVASLVASGAPWGVQQSGDSWKVYDAQGSVAGELDSYQTALQDISGRMAVIPGDRPILADRWRSDMSFENLDTGDGRFIAPGATTFRDCPLPLMLQTETEIGHFGAVLAGSIEQATMISGTAIGSGNFDDTEAGNQAHDIIAARGRFGVSIDMGDNEAEFECTERDEYDDCIDGRLVFTLCQIMGLTMTPFPAFADAFIEFADPATAAVAASGEDQAEPCVECEEEEKAKVSLPQGTPMGKRDPIPAGKREPMTAAGGPIAPPKEWFDNPGFAVGDGRMVEQPNGTNACPLTITPEGRVFGHVAPWKSCHTSYAADRCVTPPRSPSNYAYFTTGAVTTAEGDTVRVGQLTMGAGHATTDARTSLATVKAHYDGGPGAVQMADVAVGEDQFGIWFAGALRPDVTDEQVRAFSACGVSGDWREVVKGKGLDMLACAAGIPVPGFPIARAMAAAAVPEGLDLSLPDTQAQFIDGRAVALVAAGVVRQPMPWEKMIAAQAHEIAELRAQVGAMAKITAQLRDVAAGKLKAELAKAS